MYFVLNNQIWRIYPVSIESESLMRDDGSSTIGVCDNNMKAIFIANNLSAEKFRHVLIHEICHVYCFTYNVILPIDTEELLCNFVADYADDILEIADRFSRIMPIAI